MVELLTAGSTIVEPAISVGLDKFHVGPATLLAAWNEERTPSTTV
jgi:hypothetical protein